ncbi:protein tyrosine/serine/threonine phosphatase [Fragilaria crotonensis]|nr:protein tyrosine/serine/threonine phosphatase [Fragilaria crotonensis]
MTFRVAIVGAHALRVAKVLSLVKENAQIDDDVEFLPLVASFGSYEDDHGATVRYLSNVTYHGVDGKQKGASIAQFYDDFPEGLHEDKPQDPPIAIVAIGVGIEDDRDVQEIRTFLSTLAGNLEGMVLECIQPNPEYETMADETKAFQQMDADAKREATERQTIGPGKMAMFVLELLAMSRLAKGVIGADGLDVADGGEESPIDPPVEDSVHEIDESKNRYACRICRQILLGDADLQDPPHVPSRHQFSYRKQMAGTAGTNCQSLFLGSGLPWMGNISEYEGKFACPYCSAKLGIWKWAGTQCSCGTWVTPAIQIPLSKIDVVLPTER